MKQIEFPIPEGFTVPEGTMDGGSFESMATFRLKSKGKMMCITAIGETKLAGYEKGETPDSGGKEVVRKYHAAMEG